MSVEKIKKELLFSRSSLLFPDDEIQYYLNESSLQVDEMSNDLKFLLTCYNISTKLGDEFSMKVYRDRVISKLGLGFR